MSDSVIIVTDGSYNSAKTKLLLRNPHLSLFLKNTSQSNRFLGMFEYLRTGFDNYGDIINIDRKFLRVEELWREFMYV